MITQKKSKCIPLGPKPDRDKGITGSRESDVSRETSLFFVYRIELRANSVELYLILKIRYRGLVHSSVEKVPQ